MTIKQYCILYLEGNGMFKDDATAIVDGFTGTPSAMDGRWNDQTTDYPESVLDVLILGLRSFAVKWIDANQPQAWYRAMLSD